MNRPSSGGGGATIGIALLAVTCCLGAPLLAAGGFGVLGATLVHAWPVVIGLTLVIAVFVVWRFVMLQRTQRDDGPHAEDLST